MNVSQAMKLAFKSFLYLILFLLLVTECFLCAVDFFHASEASHALEQLSPSNASIALMFQSPVTAVQTHCQQITQSPAAITLTALCMLKLMNISYSQKEKRSSAPFVNMTSL